MKKRIRNFAAMLLAFAAALTLFACRDRGKDPAPSDDPAKKELALSEAERVRSFFSGVDSYRESTETTLTFPYEGVNVTIRTEGDAIYSGLSAEERFFCDLTEKETVLANGATASERTKKTGFTDGKMYLASGEQKLFSEISRSDYLAFAPVGEKDAFLSSLDDCRLVGFSSDENGSVIVITGLGDRAVADLEARFSALEEHIGEVRITDAKTTVTVDASHRPVASEIRLTFSSGKVSMTVKTGYSDWNGVSQSAACDLSAFRRTADLRLVETVAQDYRAKITPDSQNFLLTVATEKVAEGKRLTSEAKYEVTASRNVDGKYLSGVIFTGDEGGRVETEYANGTESTVAILLSTGEELARSEKKMTEAEAKQNVLSISALPMPADMTVADVTEPEGRVRFTCLNPDLSDYEGKVEVNGVAEATLDFIYEGGALKEIEYTVLFDGIDLALKGYYSYTVTRTLTFR